MRVFDWTPYPDVTVATHDGFTNEVKPVIFPNPTNGDFTVQVKESAVKIEVLNGMGVVVKEITPTGLSTTIELEIGAGLYHVKVTNDDGESWVSRLIKQ